MAESNKEAAQRGIYSPRRVSKKKRPASPSPRGASWRASREKFTAPMAPVEAAGGRPAYFSGDIWRCARWRRLRIGRKSRTRVLNEAEAIFFSLFHFNDSLGNAPQGRVRDSIRKTKNHTYIWAGGISRGRDKFSGRFQPVLGGKSRGGCGLQSTDPYCGRARAHRRTWSGRTKTSDRLKTTESGAGWRFQLLPWGGPSGTSGSGGSPAGQQKPRFTGPLSKTSRPQRISHGHGSKKRNGPVPEKNNLWGSVHRRTDVMLLSPSTQKHDSVSRRHSSRLSERSGEWLRADS